MFDEVLDLPAHPLLVHAAVVLVPALILVAVGYILLPVFRRRAEPVLLVLAVAAPLAVAIARESGEAFRRRLASRDALMLELAQRIDAHASFGQTMLVFTLMLGAASLGSIWVHRAGGAAGGADAPPRRLRALAGLVLALMVSVLAGTAGWYAFQAGHTGSTMVWEGK